MPEGFPENVDPCELNRFEAQADRWWDRTGEYGALHDINPLRAAYVAERVRLKGAMLLDVGCGGGIFAEVLAAQGAIVTGIDLGETALAVARRHARQSRLDIRYLVSSAEALASAEPAAYDAVTCMELLEHVPDPASIVRSCADLVKPGGDVVFATLNRTPLAGFLAVFMAEAILRIVARGTHRYSRFIRPSELSRWGRDAGLNPMDYTGFGYLPFFRYTCRVPTTGVNYLAHFRKRH